MTICITATLPIVIDDRATGYKEYARVPEQARRELLAKSRTTYFRFNDIFEGGLHLGGATYRVATVSKTLLRKADGAWSMRFVWRVPGAASATRTEVLRNLKGAMYDGWGESIEQLRRFGPSIQPYERPGKPSQKTDGQYGFHLSHKGAVLQLTNRRNASSKFTLG